MSTKNLFDHDTRLILTPSKDLSVVRKAAARGVCIVCVCPLPSDCGCATSVSPLLREKKSAFSPL